MSVCKVALIASASSLALLAGAVPACADDAPAGGNPADTIVVTGLRASLTRAIGVKRMSEQDVDAVSATDIGKLPDKNVADALQRLPGVNTSSAASGEGGFDENDRVSIRGTSPSLTQVTIDGHSVSTGDWFILDQFQTVGRSVSFDLLPAEIVQTTVVSKTQNAGMLEGGVAGSIDIQTRGPLSLHDGLTVEASAQGEWNSNSHQTKPQFNALVGWHNDDDTFGVIAQGFYEKRSSRRYGQETLGYTAITSAMPLGAANPSLVGVMAPTLIGSSYFDQQKTREGGFGAVEYKVSPDATLKLTGFYSHLNASNTNDNYMYWGSNELNNNLPTSYTVANNTLTSAVWPATYNGKSVDGLVVDNIVRPDASATSWYINLDADIHASSRLTLKPQVGYTRGIGDTPTEPAFEVDGGPGIAYAPSGNGWKVTPTTQNPQSPAGLANDWAWNETFKSIDKEYYGKIDGTLDFGPGVLKSVDFGLRAARHERDVEAWDRGCSLGANGQCWTSPAMPYSAVNPTSYPSGFNAGSLGIPGLLIPIAGNPQTIINTLNGITDGVHGPISSIVQPLNYYWPGTFDVKETDVEGYLMAHVGGENWHGNIGVRFANTQEHVNANVSGGNITTSAYGNYSVVPIVHNYFDILPSINLSFDAAPQVQLRASIAETMSRPDFSALGGAVSLTDVTLTGNGGNPNLKPVKATVFDGAAAWYYRPGAVAAVSVFHDELQSYVTYGNTTGSYFSEFWGGYKTYTITEPYNISGQLSGVELQVQQPVGYGFGFQANGTWVTGHDETGAPLVGTSKWTYNLVGYYDKGPLNARLAYTYRSHFLVGLDRSSAENQNNYGSLDGSVSVALNHAVTLTFDARNITNAKLKYYGENTTQVRAVYDNGTQLFFGGRVKF